MSSLARSSAVMAAGTVVSRLTGFVRASVIAAVLGLGVTADVFNAPNAIPNSLYILVAGGVLNSVLVPQLVRAIKQDPDGGEAYAQRVVTAVCLLLLGASVLGVVAAPWVLRLYVSDAFLAPELRPQFDAMVAFTRFCLPQVFFYGVYVLVGQVLNARGSFGPMMWAPILNNVVAIAVFGSYLVFVGSKDQPVFTEAEVAWFGLGSTLGIAVQALVLLPLVHRAGVRLRPRTDLRGVGLGKAGRLGLWTVGFVLLNQLAYVVVVRLATGATAQAAVSGSDAAVGVTVYSYAFLLVMVPHSIVTVSLATALLPRMSAHAAEGSLAAVRDDLVEALRTCLAVIVPAALLLVALAGPLARLLFGFGAAAEEAGQVSTALIAFAPGLVAFTVHYLVLRGFYALEDTRTPFFLQVVVATVNVVAASTVVLLVLERTSGLALTPAALAASYSLAYLLGAVVSLSALARRLDGPTLAGVAGYVLRVSSAAALGAVLAALLGAGVTALAGRTSAAALLAVTLGGLVFLAAYVPAARLLRVGEVESVLALVTARFRLRVR